MVKGEIVQPAVIQSCIKMSVWSAINHACVGGRVGTYFGKSKHHKVKDLRQNTCQ